MSDSKTILDKIRLRLEKHGLAILQVTVALVFIWFGVLKFFPGNAAESIAGSTIGWISGGYIPKPTSLYLLGGFECLLGIGLLFRRALKVIIPMLYVQMAGTILPLVIFPDKTWAALLMPTLEGQYIIKNAVIIAAAIILGAAGRGGKLIVHPEVAKEAEKEQEEKLQN